MPLFPLLSESLPRVIVQALNLGSKKADILQSDVPE